MKIRTVDGKTHVVLRNTSSTHLSHSGERVSTVQDRWGNLFVVDSHDMNGAIWRKEVIRKITDK